MRHKYKKHLAFNNFIKSQCVENAAFDYLVQFDIVNPNLIVRISVNKKEDYDRLIDHIRLKFGHTVLYVQRIF